MSSNSSNDPEKFQPSSSTKSSEKSKSRVYFCQDRNRVVIENDEFYISELCDLERDFEDEFFIECDPKELSLFYARNGWILINNLEGRLRLDLDAFIMPKWKVFYYSKFIATIRFFQIHFLISVKHYVIKIWKRSCFVHIFLSKIFFPHEGTWFCSCFGWCKNLAILKNRMSILRNKIKYSNRLGYTFFPDRTVFLIIVGSSSDPKLSFS